MAIPTDYDHRVYAGVLGKIIGVYLGRPFEGWDHRSILEKLGEVNYYVHEKLNAPLIVADDDISGTFGFLRALEDYPAERHALTAAHIGHTWLNMLIENKTVLWWGGMGMSTEHTAYLRLKKGIDAPASGSIALNGQVVAEQIGSQIFIDGWGMVCPGDMKAAAALAEKAASVSHDGEAIYGAQIVAALVAGGFVQTDLNALLDAAADLIPLDSVIATMIRQLRAYHHREPADWKACFRDVMQARFGYDKYGGNCHMVPNHGVIILALLYGGDDFQKSLMIANTCGWDTDCNSGNVGCIQGVRLGLEGIDAGPDWRGPVADRLVLPTADGGLTITDAATQAVRIANLGRKLVGIEPVIPKHGAQFHFALPGSVQGFRVDDSPETRGTTTIGNVRGQLLINYQHLAHGRPARASTPTFITPEYAKMGGYGLFACPTIHSGQVIRTRLTLAPHSQPVHGRLFVRHYGPKDALVTLYSQTVSLEPGNPVDLTFVAPDTGGMPFCELGLEVCGLAGACGGVFMDHLSISGDPTVTFGNFESCPMARRQWVEGVSSLQHWGKTADDQVIVAIQNEGRGLAITGNRSWREIKVATTLTPHLAKVFGLAVRVQGLRRYYALLVGPGPVLRLVKVAHHETLLASKAMDWDHGQPIAMSLEARGGRVIGWVNDEEALDAALDDPTLAGGGIAMVIEEGRLAATPVSVEPS